MHVKEEDNCVVSTSSSGGAGDGEEYLHLNANSTIFPDYDDLGEDFRSKLPASLWSDDIEVPSRPELAIPDLGQQDYRNQFSGSIDREEKKQAALKKIAELQQWATMKNGNGARATSIPPESNSTLDARRAAWQSMMQQKTLMQQQQQIQQAAALQRIIQDYLSGKQLTLIEQQILQQYIRQQQEQRFQPSYSQNDISRATSYTPAHMNQSINHMSKQMHEQEQLARVYQERLSMATVGNGNMQARMTQARAEAMLAMQRKQQQSMAHNQNYYAPTADPRYMQSQQQHSSASSSWTRQNGSFNNSRGGVPTNGQQYHAQVRYPTNETKVFQQNASIGAVRQGPANPGGREGVMNPIQTLRDIGKTLYHLGITVEGAVNAGLLGGLSASDIRIVLESYRIESDFHSSAPHAAMPNASASIPFAPRPPQVSTLRNAQLQRAASGSFSNLSAPTPSSPAWSAGAGSTGSLPLHMGSSMPRSPKSKGTSIADDESADSLLDQLIESSNEAATVNKKDAVAMPTDDDATFDAAQYGFFEGVGTNGHTSGELDDDALVTVGNTGSSRSADDSGLLNYLNGLKLGTDFS